MKYLKGQGVMEKYKTSEEKQTSSCSKPDTARRGSGLGAVRGRGFYRTWEGGEAAEGPGTSQIIGDRAPLLRCVG